MPGADISALCDITLLKSLVKCILRSVGPLNLGQLCRRRTELSTWSWFDLGILRCFSCALQIHSKKHIHLYMYIYVYVLLFSCLFKQKCLAARRRPQVFPRVRKRQFKSSNNYLGVVFTNWLFFGISSSQLACFQVAFSYITTLWKELTAGERDRKHALLDCWEVVVVFFLPFSFFFGFCQKLHRLVLV